MSKTLFDILGEDPGDEDFVHEPDAEDCARTLARRTDPATSHEAAESIALHLGRLQRFAADTVRLHPGHTARELDSIYPGSDGMIRKRLKECERRGLVRRGPARVCSISRRNAATWFPIEVQPCD